MTGTSSTLVAGRTRWRRFGAVLIPVLVVMGLLFFLIGSGSLAASFVVSGSEMKVTTSSIQSTGQDTNGNGLYQFGVVDFTASGAPKPQFETVLPSAALTDLCQSVTVGPLTLVTKAGAGGTPVSATNLIVDAKELNATSATFNNLRIGQDMSTFGLSAPTAPGAPGSPNVSTGPVPAGTFGQAATGATINGVKQTSLGQQATSITLPGLSISFGSPCF